MKSALLGVLLAVAPWSAAAHAQEVTGAVPSTSSPAGSADSEGASSTRSRAPADQARDLGREGLHAYGESNYEAALDRFTRAEELAHSPVFQLYRARCLIRLDRVEEARALLEGLTRETLSESAPDAWRRARVEAEKELRALPVVPAAGAEAQAGALSEGFDADGHVEASISGEPRMPTWHPEPTPAPGFWRRTPPNRKAALVAFGVGTVGLMFTAVTGGLAIARSAQVRENCMGTSCRPQDLPLAQEATLLANVATVGAAIAIAGGTTGAVLWLLPTAKADAEVALVLSGPSLQVLGSF